MLFMFKKIYTVIVLIFNLLIRREHYKLHFIAEVDPPIKRWYYDFKWWGFDHANLEMVSGADALCEMYANGENDVTVNIIARRTPLAIDCTTCDMYIAELPPKNADIYDKYLLGRTYHKVSKQGEKVTMWICPVTLFVLGRYPKYIYIKK